ncbi:MAG: hypothetical protein ACOYMI_06720 [Phycisphaerales bacterium]
MDPTAIALALGLEQAQASQAAAAPNSPAAATAPIRVQGQPIALPLSDRCSNAPLFQLEGEPVRLDLTAGAWLARLRGNVAFGPVSTSKVDVNDTYGLDSMEGAFQGDLSILWRNWTVRLTGSEFSTDATQAATTAGAFGTTTFAAGDSLRSSFDFYSWGIDVQSWLWRPLSKQQFPWESPVAGEDLGGDLQFVAIVGGRGFGVNQQVQNQTVGTSSTYSETFGTVIVGGGVDVQVDLRGRVDFLDRLEFSATGTWGPAWPGDGGSETEIRAALTAWLCGNAGVFFGYRYTNLELTQGGYAFSGNIAGLLVGASLRY